MWIVASKEIKSDVNRKSFSDRNFFLCIWSHLQSTFHGGREIESVGDLDLSTIDFNLKSLPQLRIALLRRKTRKDSSFYA